MAGDRFDELLDAIVLEPELDSLLVYDADASLQWSLAEALRSRWAAVHAPSPGRLIVLGGGDTEDELWGFPVEVQSHGLLAGRLASEAPAVVFIQDLTSASLAVLRACVLLIGQHELHLERQMQSRVLRPRFRFLACCASEDVSRVSRHLLDRFAIRISARRAGSKAERLVKLERDLAALEHAEGLNSDSHLDVVAKFRERAEIEVTDGAIRSAAHIADAANLPGHRAELALLRLARGVARARGDTEVTEELVEAARVLAELPQPPKKQEQTAPEAREPVQRDLELPDSGAAPGEPEPQPVLPTRHAAAPRPVPAQPSGVAPPPPVPVPVPVKNSAQISSLPIELEREKKADLLASLQLPIAKSAAGGRGRGAIVGIEEARSLRDLAIAPSLFAAQLRRIRDGLTIDLSDLQPGDLRSYRRAPASGSLLEIVVDFTAISGSAWAQSLLPFLRRAYAARAAISIIKVGAKSAEREACAQIVEARRVLVPRVIEALDQQPGRATPLAHGLELARSSIERAQTERRFALKTTLIVLSDGRGNVPLVNSLAGEAPKNRIGREGIDSALEIARKLAELPRVERFLLDPQPPFMRRAPAELGRALGARVLAVPRARVEQAS